MPHWPLHRRALSRFGNRYTSFALRTGLPDAASVLRDARTALQHASTSAWRAGPEPCLEIRPRRTGPEPDWRTRFT